MKLTDQILKDASSNRLRVSVYDSRLGVGEVFLDYLYRDRSLISYNRYQSVTFDRKPDPYDHNYVHKRDVLSRIKLFLKINNISYKQKRKANGNYFCYYLYLTIHRNNNG